jgi:spore coat polysaccharide biosynthesis protein SpsF (cytidylyltransferase family)
VKLIDKINDEIAARGEDLFGPNLVKLDGFLEQVADEILQRVRAGTYLDQYIIATRDKAACERIAEWGDDQGLDVSEYLGSFGSKEGVILRWGSNLPCMRTDPDAILRNDGTIGRAGESNT